MRFMIASDLHGSAYYCKKLTDVFKSEKADKLVLLGDLLYHGPRNELPRDYDPKGVADALNGIKEDVIAVRGNCDSEVDQYVLKFPIKAEYIILCLGDKTVFATHGDKYSAEELTKADGKEIYLCGHTHVFKMTTENGRLSLNPGSVSLPKENSPRGYFLMDSETLVYKTLDGEILKSMHIGE